MGALPPFGNEADDEGADDQYEGLAALDYSYGADSYSADSDGHDSYGADSDGHGSGLDVFGESYRREPDSSVPHLDDGAELDQSDDGGAVLDAFGESDDELDIPLFGVTNPPGTVTVTAYLDGRVQQIELSPKVTTMTETDLADEILVIAGLAAQDARSAQYSVMLDGMREQGHDDFATRDFLTRELQLPTPEQADSARAEVFTTRYGADHG